MAHDTLDYGIETPAPPAAIAKQIEEQFVGFAMQCGAQRAYVKKIGAKWHFIAEFAEADLESYGRFAKVIERAVPGTPLELNVKKAGQS
jgi:hypothetical protein